MNSFEHYDNDKRFMLPTITCANFFGPQILLPYCTITFNLKIIYYTLGYFKITFIKPLIFKAVQRIQQRHLYKCQYPSSNRQQTYQRSLWYKYTTRRTYYRSLTCIANTISTAIPYKRSVINFFNSHLYQLKNVYDTSNVI